MATVRDFFGLVSDGGGDVTKITDPKPWGNVAVDIIGWLFRGGALLTSFFSALPVVRNFDPLPILGEKKGKK